MSLALATAETGCTYNTGSPATVTLSGTALDYCVAAGFVALRYLPLWLSNVGT